MKFFSRRIALALTLCNVLSAGISFVSTVFYSRFFSLNDIGGLATVTSVSAMALPLIVFRLDLAFQRLSYEERPGLTALILVWGGGVAVVLALAGLAAHFLLGWQSLLAVIAIPIHLMFTSANNAVWAQKVCDRRLKDVAILQILRAVFAGGLPFALIFWMRGENALVCGQIIGQLTFLLFLPKLQNFRFDRLSSRLFWVRSEAPDLILDNTVPILVNTASLNLNPILAASIFGPEAAAVIWLIFRLFLMPASIIADPVRRDFYVNFTDGRLINADVRRPILIYKSVVLASMVLFAFAVVGISQFYDISTHLGELEAHSLIVVLGVCWAGAILFNAPSTGLIPVLQMARLQSAVEVLGFVVRIGALCLGFLGLSMVSSLELFLALTVLINLFFGIAIDWTLWRRCGER